jgi:uncharacterized protein involved in response to NO
VDDARTPREKSYLALCCEEPFRIFFPLGVLVGISGVSLWPLYFSGIHKFYPGIMHARLMIEGFMGAFVIGFLGTAGPRLTGTAHFSRTELGALVTLFAAAVGMHIGERYFFGDLIFLALLLFFAVRMSGRFLRRTDLPPPTFALVAFAFLTAIVAAILLLIGAFGSGSPRCTLLGMLLLYQGFVLYLVLGIGGFLLPRFLVLPAKPDLPETRELTGPWKRRALFALGIGFLLLASFVVEVFLPAPRLAAWLRFGAAGTFLASEIPLHRSAARRVTVTRALRLALVLLLLGLFFPVLWPWQRVAGLHLVFIGGFTLIAFTVATRVVLGHTGQGHLVSEPLRFLRATTVLLLLGAAFRIAGDFFLAPRGPLLSVASYLWITAAIVWSCRVLRRVRIPDTATETSR